MLPLLLLLLPLVRRFILARFAPRILLKTFSDEAAIAQVNVEGATVNPRLGRRRLLVKSAGEFGAEAIKIRKWGGTKGQRGNPFEYHGEVGEKCKECKKGGKEGRKDGSK